MVDVLRSLDIEYVCSNPGSSFRALHESIVNYGGNQKPEFITCLHDRDPVVWNTATQEKQFSLAGHAAFASHAAWSPDGQRIATAGSDATVRIWDPSAGLQAAVIPVRHPVTALKQAGELLVVGFATRGIMGLAVTL